MNRVQQHLGLVDESDNSLRFSDSIQIGKGWLNFVVQLAKHRAYQIVQCLTFFASAFFCTISVLISFFNSDKVMDDVRIGIAQNMCWFFHHLVQIEPRSCHIDLIPFKNCYIIVVLAFAVQTHPSAFCIWRTIHQLYVAITWEIFWI